MEEKLTLGEIISRLAHAMDNDLIGRGERAALRRLDVQHPHSPAFWRAMVTWGPPGDAPANETGWAMILSGMAAMAPRPHRQGFLLGRALAQADLSEARFLRLLKADGPVFEDLVRRLTRFLAVKAEPVDWVELAQFILTTDETKKEEIRRRIARAYYAFQ